MKNNLVPEYRTDKNGRTVLRHVRGQESSPAKVLPKTPAIAKVSAKAKQQLILETSLMLAEVVSRNYSDDVARMIRDTARTYLNKMSASTISSVKNYSWDPMSALQFATDIESGWSQTKVNDYLALSSALRLPYIDRVSNRHLDSYRLYPDLCRPNNSGEYPEERLSQITALYAVTEEMTHHQDQNPYHYDFHSENVTCFYVSDADLRELLLHPGNKYSREDVVNVIKDHKTFDAQRIKSLLDFGVPSLTGGLL